MACLIVKLQRRGALESDTELVHDDPNE